MSSHRHPPNHQLHLPTVAGRRPDPVPALLAQARALGWAPDPRRWRRWHLPGTCWYFKVSPSCVSIYALGLLREPAEVTRYPLYKQTKIVGHLSLLAQEGHA